MAITRPPGPRRGFYQAVKKRGYSRSRGRLAEVDAFRVGCIGHFGEAGMPGAGAAIADTLNAMSVHRMSAEAMA
ncbi:2-aminoethylphosphonate--pyruvate aminotransferase [Burkholderia cenocepacia]|uniref:2-aminoethylphosphonate--pyruvate aminotransferase n=1 Tax=Burkholderia cenocepacia TaxID=95486 RepID=A0A3Q9F8V7_9BURK|nr:2-aminoethylphosphonate--pyruvate aminotransferase [Burkholderia cenocepacia]AZQ52664.1 2-aminoethylphosphonate--pyruvate aminotransferase [Burkholderia cenocepacia]